MTVRIYLDLDKLHLVVRGLWYRARQTQSAQLTWIDSDEVGYGLLRVILAAEVVASVIGAILQWVSSWQHARSRRRRGSRAARELIEQAAGW